MTSQFGRHEVTEVSKDLSAMHLTLKKENEETTVKCVLRGSWIYTLVNEGDIVNLLADYNSVEEAYVIDDLTGLLIVNPDLLISGTSVVSAVFCMRKSVLNEVYKGLSGSSKTMFIGTLVHELLQDCLRTKAQTKTQVQNVLQNIMSKKSILQDIVALEMTEENVRQEVEPFLSHVLYFIQR